MTIKEAYKIAKKYSIDNKRGDHLHTCIDFKDSFGFDFTSPELIGHGLICVDKDTGIVYIFTPPMDFEKFDRRIKLDVKEVLKDVED